MQRMTPAELHKLLVQAVMEAYQELANSGSNSPGVLRAQQLLSTTMNRVVYAAHRAYPDRADISAAMDSVPDSRGKVASCSCKCHADKKGRRDWPLFTDTLGEITACSRCRDEHLRVMPPRDSAA